jgi:hypothetical protein
MFTLIGAFGIVCVVLVPILYVGSWVVLGQLGKSLSAIDPSNWERMRPGLFPKLSEVRAHNDRFREFVQQREYLALRNPRITRLVTVYRLSVIATWVAIVAALISIALVVLGP